MKARQGQHLSDVKRLLLKGEKSDSFAAHFADHFHKGTKVTNDELRRTMEYKIIWQANPISCMKTFGKLNCSLCMRERIEILRAFDQADNEYLVINSNNEIFGACRHKTRFHRFRKETSNVKSTRTDEGVEPERGRKDRDGDKETMPSPTRPARRSDITPPLGDQTICSPILVSV